VIDPMFPYEDDEFIVTLWLPDGGRAESRVKAPRDEIRNMVEAIVCERWINEPCTCTQNDVERVATLVLTAQYVISTFRQRGYSSIAGQIERMATAVNMIIGGR
jgi:hypothetical protein